MEPGLIQLQGYLRPQPIQNLWRHYLSLWFDHTTRSLAVLMWQSLLADWG